MERQNRIVGVAGRKGSGKSTIARLILEQCRRLFLFDTMGEHSWVPDRHENLDQALVYVMESPHYSEFSASLIPQGDNFELEFIELCDVIYETGKECKVPMLFAVEEVPMLTRPNYTPKKFHKIIRLGRHAEISLLYTAQRIGECSRALTSATDVFVLFTHTEPRDLDAIAERTNSDLARKVQTLGDHGFLVWDVIEQREIACELTWSISSLDSRVYSQLVEHPKAKEGVIADAG